MASVGFKALDEKSLLDYIRSTPSLASRISNQFDDLQIKVVGDGNMNFVFIVVGRSGGSFVIKQKVSQYNRWTSPYLDEDALAVREDDDLKLEVAELKSMFCERAQALVHGDLHTSSVMVTQVSTQVIDPEFSFYGPMGFDIGAFLGNLILAFFAQDGLSKQDNERKAYKEWILKTIEETWNLFHAKFLALWDEHISQAFMINRSFNSLPK